MGKVTRALKLPGRELGTRDYEPITAGGKTVKTENKIVVLAVIVMFAALALMWMSESAEGAEPPDVVVEQMHDLVQKTCFDNPDLDPGARDRCSLYVIQTLRNEYDAEQAAPPVSAAPPPPGAVDSTEPPPAPIMDAVVEVEGD